MSDPRASAAPGAPGIDPTWSSSRKDAVGASHVSSRVWYTVGQGILNEVYWPRVDLPQIRDLGFIVADDDGFWSEVTREATHDIRQAPGRGRTSASPLRTSRPRRSISSAFGSRRARVPAACLGWRSL